MKHAKRIIALLLAVVMIIGVLPLASAANVGPFTDVQDNVWYGPFVAYVYEYGLMNGLTKTTFGPNETCTRAMAATVLYRIEGEPEVSEPATFTDLTANWYLKPIAWAEDEAVVNGVGNGKFDPDGLVTREQLVTMIWRYAGSPAPVVDGGIDGFADGASVSNYAKTAFNWAISKEIINGKGGKLDPAGNATRAEFAKIITVYDQSTEPCENHTWVDGDVIKEATCTEAGEMEIICSVCGEKSTKEIPALGHNYVDGVCAGCGDKLADGEAVIYYTNDIHTYIDKDLSYDNIADLKAQTEKVAADVLLVDAGDHAQGTAFGGMDKGQTIIELMNAAGYDYATLGNHEFDYGMDGAMNFIKWADFQYLSANFYHEEAGVRGENVLDSYAIVELAGKKVALIGITTPESFTKSTPAYFQDENGNYIYGIAGGEDGAALYADVQAAIDAAKAEGAEIIIALAHLGDDPASDPWNSEDVIANTTGLDALIDGHSHSTVEGKKVADKAGNEVLLTQTGEYFNAIGKMSIDAEGNITTELITSYTGSDASVKADVDAWIAEVDTLLGTVVAKSEIDFIIKDESGRLIRKQETNLGDFCADALYYLFDNMGMDVDVAIMNGGGIRADMPAGDISYKTTKTVHTFGNVACLQTITGQQLLDALEWGAKNVGVGENGGFLQVSGITYEIHSYIPSTVQADDKGVWCGAPTGEYRVKNVMVGGEPLDVNAKYNLAGYNYTLRDLGDGFAMFDGAVNVLDYVMEDYLVLANYAASFPEATIKADNSVLGANYGDKYGEGRIEIITEEIKPENYVAIFNPAKGKVMTTASSVYNNKDQMVSADAKLNAEGKIETTATDVALFKIETTDAGITTFTTKDGKYLYCDGTNVRIVEEAGEFTEFVLDEAEGGSYIRLANYLHEGKYAQYLEFYANVFTCFGMTATSDLAIYTFTFPEVAETTGGGDGGDDDHGENAVFEKVTADLGNWEGSYVIGWDDGTNAVIFDGQNDANENHTASALTNNTVVAPSSSIIVIEAVEGGYTLKATGGYLNGTEAANDMVFEAEPSVATIEWIDGNPIITSAAGTICRYNNVANSSTGGNYSWFRFYKPTSSVQTPVALYKLTDGEVPPPCEHIWNEGEVTTEPTCTAKGEKTYTCGLCGATKTEAIDALGHNYVDGICSVCGDDINEVKYVAIFNDANGKVMTDEVSVYNSKDQLKSAAATLNAEGKLETEATNVLTFKKETNVDGITSFITEDGKYLYCDGTHLRLAEEGGDYTEFILDEVDGGYYIRLANYLHNGTSAQYIEYFKDVFTCWGMGEDTSIYIFNFYELAETEDIPPCEHVWDEGTVTAPTCTEDGKTVYTCTLCGETVTEPIAALGHNFVDGICSVCGEEENTDTPIDAFVLATELKDGVQVVIYNASNKMAVTSTPSGYYFAGAQVEAEADAIVTEDASIIWTAVENADGSFSFKQGDAALSIVVSGTYFNLSMDAADAGWTISPCNAENNSYYIYSSTLTGQYGNVYLEWYANKSAFSAYCTGADRLTEKDFGFQFFVKAESDDVTPPCAHEWDEGEVTTEPDCTTAGEMTYNCIHCDATKTEEIAALGHADEDGNNECDDCGTLLGGDLTEVAFADLQDGDVIMIVMHTSPEMTNKDFVLLNNYGATPKNNAAEFTGEHNETMYFTVNIADDGTITLTAGDNNLYCTASGNNGLCCSTTEPGAIGYDETIGYLTIVDGNGSTRYIGVYDNNGGDMSKVENPNFRAYKMKDDGTIANIGGQTLTIYKIG